MICRTFTDEGRTLSVGHGAALAGYRVHTGEPEGSPDAFGRCNTGHERQDRSMCSDLRKRHHGTWCSTAWHEH